MPGARLLLLTSDEQRRKAWQAAWTGEVIPAGETVQGVARALRRPYLDLIASLGARQASLAWWVSRISERNTAVSSLFESCVWLHAARAEQVRSNTPLCVVCDRPEVLDALAGVPPSRRGGTVRRIGKGGLWALRCVRKVMAARAVEPPRGDEPFVLIRTWVDEASVTEGRGLQDRYFPGLATWLRERGHRVVTLPVMFGVRHESAVWRALGTGDGEILPEFRLYRVSDFLYALRTGWASAALDIGPVELAGVQVGDLFAHERERWAMDGGTLDAALCSRLARRLADRGLNVERVIDTYENMIPEKGLIWGFRTCAPDARLVGFQHGALYPLLLCNFVTAAEAEIAPLPDVVVCNGPRFRQLLVSEGLPPDRTIVGAALRYRHLRRVADPASRDEPRILAPLPLTVEIASEFLEKICRALPGWTVVLKPHPMAPIELALSALTLTALPAGFSVARGTMHEALSQATTVVSTASTTALEAVAAGVPVVVVGGYAAVDLNPLDWNPELAPVVRDSEGIRREVERIAALGDEALASYREAGRRLLDEYFSPVNDTTLQQFLR